LKIRVTWRTTSQIPPDIGMLFMMPRLRDEDRLAVDLLLDRAVTGSGGNGSSDGNGNGHSGNGHSGFTPVHGANPEQSSRAEAVLRVLDMMPADEPPADLVARTLRRVETESARHDPSALRPIQPDVPEIHVPHA